MATSDREFAPYAPPANIITIIGKQRKGTLPEQIDNKLLIRLGLSEGIVTRVIQALRFFDLVDDQGSQTDTFQRLRKATPDEYPEALAAILRDAYSSVFEIIPDPAAASDAELSNAFWQYEPQGQRTRMVTLFLGLCREANLINDGQMARRASSRKPAMKKAGTTVSHHTPTASEKPHTEVANSPDVDRKIGHKHPSSGGYSGASAKYDLIQVLIGQLPEDCRWTKKRRDQWLGALTANIDLIIDIMDVNEHESPATDVDASGAEHSVKS